LVSVTVLAHLYFSFANDISPLTWHLVLLLFSPFIFFVWKDASSIKLTTKGFELEKLKAGVEKTIKKAITTHKIDSNSLNELFISVESNEWIKLVLARMLMRKGLSALVTSSDMGDTPSIQKLIEQCRDEKKLSTQDIEEIEKLRNVTFYAEWWSGNPPTVEDWSWALNNCQSIIEKIYNKQLIV
jgi:hypothetical protein